MEKKVQEIESAIKKAQTTAEEVKTSVENKLSEMDKKFENIDKSLEDMNKKMTTPKVEKKAMSLGEAVAEAVNSEEFKSGINNLNENKTTRFSVEVKVDSTSLIGEVGRTQINNNVYGIPFGALTFVPRVANYPVAVDKGRIMYVDGSFTSNTDYVGEGQAVATASSAAATERYRQLAKIGNYMPFTAEALADTSVFVNWAQNQARAAIIAKVDEQILNGNGNDSTAPKHVYGLKTIAPAFNATTAGLATAIENADLISLVLACKAQIVKATKGVYKPNAIFISSATYAKLANLRNANNDYIGLISYREALSQELGVEIIESQLLGDNEMLVGYVPVIQLHQKGGFELEVERKADTDSYVIYLRWRGNVVVPADEAKALVWVENIDSAIAAITKAQV